jgi:hypothetical protein
MTRCLDIADTDIMTTTKYPVGTEYVVRGITHRVVDILTTYNLASEVVKVRYVAEHQFLGQSLRDNDVIETTIARALYKG